ncbi:MAG: hypothetical protein ACREM3_11670 [Candidatus Rokuibacteriota bacterium]
MTTVLHVMKGGGADLALATLAGQLAAGDRVTVALLHGTPPPKLPDAVRVLRVPEDASYERLLELIFESDRVTAW